MDSGSQIVSQAVGGGVARVDSQGLIDGAAGVGAAAERLLADGVVIVKIGVVGGGVGGGVAQNAEDGVGASEQAPQGRAGRWGGRVVAGVNGPGDGAAAVGVTPELGEVAAALVGAGV